jgi:hypothetical protein
MFREVALRKKNLKEPFETSRNFQELIIVKPGFVTD